MRCLIAVLVVFAFCLTPLATQAGRPDPKPKDAKVLIAHLADTVTTETEGEDEGGNPALIITTTKYYVVLEISPNAVAAHEAHGDMDPGEHEKGDRFEIETTETVPI